MRILEHRFHQAEGETIRTRLETVLPLLDRPAEVVAAHDGCRDMINLLPQVLSHIADVEVSVGAVEAPAPRIAEAELPDLPPPSGSADVGIVRRNHIGCRTINVEAENLPQ